ncbi:unnamed protein product [Rotaria magnacalcarata]|uniref:Uncharacterized protein n=2 Tax=Rotaria magnacalcarata TaxID=392030 RepID=A0A819XUT9_9BILA|nr:unnamed protein product [Rotaria magnacalcarata]CAF2079859.1 unnamed protein product [Rotaria magnacalcarata]CAF4145002.1 unnamed protein product [Rotaria magnacalcarata]CAF4469329.1 unnamed protein product [Rotaria magnacalcarata]
MQATSNNHYQTTLPFTPIQSHSNKSSEDDAGYDSITDQAEKQERIRSIAGLSSSSSNNQVQRIVNIVANMPSYPNISTTNETNDIAISVTECIAKFSKNAEPTRTKTVSPTRKINRTRIQPLLDVASDSADSFVQSYEKQISQDPTISSIDILRFSGELEHICDTRFDSITTVDHVKNDVIAIELMEQQKNNQMLDTHLHHNKQHLSWINRLGESIRLLPANVLAVIFIGLIGGLFVSAIFVIIIA